MGDAQTINQGLAACVAGRHYAVLGLGRSGIATAHALQAAGALVTAWDDKNRPVDTGFRIAPLLDEDMSSFEALVMSPGIPHTFPEPHPVAAAAKAADVPLISDIELLMRANAVLPKDQQRKILAITGTNGKSTTTELLAHLFREAGVPLSVGGNLGPAALSLQDPGAKGVFVLEMSSYQLELIDQGTIDVAGFLNLSPDHLERHGGLDGYVAAKRRIFEHLHEDGKAVICVDQDIGRDFARSFQSKTVPVSTVSKDADVSAFEGQLQSTDFGFDLKTLSRFPGQHNWQNFALAFCMGQQAGLDAAGMVQAMHNFGGLAHRQEYVGEFEGIRFVNDSKATNPEAAEVALQAYDNIYWIAGGLAKAEGVEPLLPYVDRVKKAFLIGEAAKDFAATLNGKVAFEVNHTLDQAVEAAFQQAQQAQSKGTKSDNTAKLHNPVILLSPACASFDQFVSFEVRGERFKTLYRQLVSARG